MSKISSSLVKLQENHSGHLSSELLILAKMGESFMLKLSPFNFKMILDQSSTESDVDI